MRCFESKADTSLMAGMGGKRTLAPKAGGVRRGRIGLEEPGSIRLVDGAKNRAIVPVVEQQEKDQQ